MLHIARGSFWPATLPVDQDRAEVRIYAAVMTGFFLYILLEAAIYAWTVTAAPLFRIVALTHYPRAVLTAFFLCAAAVIPHFASLIAIPSLLDSRIPRLMATAGSAAAGLLWFYFANEARELDYQGIQYLYATRGVFCLAVATVFAFSLNSQQLRARINV